MSIWLSTNHFTVCFSVDETQPRGRGSDQQRSHCCLSYLLQMPKKKQEVRRRTDTALVYPHCFHLVVTLTSCRVACCSPFFVLSHWDARSGTQNLAPFDLPSINTSRNRHNYHNYLIKFELLIWFTALFSLWKTHCGENSAACGRNEPNT